MNFSVIDSHSRLTRDSDFASSWSRKEAMTDLTSKGSLELNPVAVVELVEAAKSDGTVPDMTP
jgi:hypothetical protein